jgi:hypothetical protein
VRKKRKDQLMGPKQLATIGSSGLVQWNQVLINPSKLLSIITITQLTRANLSSQLLSKSFIMNHLLDGSHTQHSSHLFTQVGHLLPTLVVHYLCEWTLPHAFGLKLQVTSH